MEKDTLKRLRLIIPGIIIFLLIIPGLTDNVNQLMDCVLLKNFKIKLAKEVDWHTEYLDMILSIRVVSDIDQAINHVNRYGTSHSDAIVTENYKNALKFLEKIDSSSVYVNASTRFTDGREFGKGAEIGISTNKLHARGPMGVEDLTTYKYIILGNGQIRK